MSDLSLNLIEVFHHPHPPYPPPRTPLPLQKSRLTIVHPVVPDCAIPPKRCHIKARPEREMESQTAISYMNASTPCSLPEPAGCLIWGRICSFFSGLFRSKVNKEAEELQRELLIERNKTAFLEKEFLRMEKDHVNELGQLTLCSYLRIDAGERSFNDMMKKGSIEVQSLFKIQEDLTGEHACLSVRYNQLRSIAANINKEFFVAKQRNFDLSKTNEHISAQNTILKQQNYRNQQIIGSYYRQTFCKLNTRN